ncbi:uncharacterized protein HMPREF1541_07635 [Cyphellophora europaea CBS 101466]|uniref:Uncharacterized protein n=1 Tax=Cyphellophora europaea (strain CBS 101466) TaxID=1220924 RepID=W2RNH2_CYPE1|nr:uncharacterized protein HMPREF1541_07635 [Cyphellophora europaea CBS 101466]ETN38012.1 hypothetical protein HMPREF1541_07635 [Cyphellophora europaea CBS 101466]
MAAPAPPQIVINDPATAHLPADEPTPRVNGHSAPSAKPNPPTIDTSETTTSAGRTTGAPLPTSKPVLNRTNSLTTTPADSASCYLCDEQNPGDFSPTTKHLSACLLCSRYFCLIHQAPSQEGVCNINHSSYYHDMLLEARAVLKAQQQSETTPDGDSASPQLEGRTLAEVLIQEGIYPSLGEREKAIFATSPVDKQKQRELESFRSLDAAVANGGVRGEKGSVEVKEAVGADIAI